MDESINNNKYKIKGNNRLLVIVITCMLLFIVLTPSKFSINTDTSSSTPYKNGGRVKQVKTPFNVNFVS